jgi:hypothetical protein
VILVNAPAVVSYSLIRSYQLSRGIRIAETFQGASSVQCIVGDRGIPLPFQGASAVWVPTSRSMPFGIKKTKAPTPTRRMGLVCFIMARVNHLYPSGFGFIMAGRIFSLFMKVKGLGTVSYSTEHGA